MSKDLRIGTILESYGKFAKVINVRNGIYGLSGWTDRKNTEKATVAHVHMNGRAILTNSDISIVSSVKAAKAAPAKAATPAAPKAPKAAKPKSTIAKPAVKKAAKKAQKAQKPAKKATTRKSK